jgi:hypothetical protein
MLLYTASRRARGVSMRQRMSGYISWHTLTHADVYGQQAGPQRHSRGVHDALIYPDIRRRMLTYAHADRRASGALRAYADAC